MSEGKTLALRRLITTMLNTLDNAGGTYADSAPLDAAYPYKVYSLSRVDLGDMERDVYDLTIDLWDKHPSSARIEDIGDRIEELLHDQNLPQQTILPTFFRASRYPVDDQDKDLRRIQLHFDVQLYENY